MISSLILTLGVSIGIGALFPRVIVFGHSALGFLAFCGFCGLAFAVYLLVVVLGLGLEITALAVVLAAGAGLVLRRRGLVAAISERWPFSHPVVILTGIVLAAWSISDPVAFLPYGDDTYTNWLSIAKQYWLADGFRAEGLGGGGVGYLPGWHLLIALASVGDVFSDDRPLGVSAALHIAMLGLIYDICAAFIARRCPSVDPVQRYGAAFLIVLLAVAAEASWQLVPSLVLAEIPLFYTLIGAGMLLLLYRFDGTSPRLLSLMLGVVMACHYAIKGQGAPAVPAAALVVFFYNTGGFSVRGMAQNAVCAGLTVLPAATVAVSWALFGTPSPKCVASLEALLSVSGGNGAGAAVTLMSDILAKTGGYLGSYKVPVTVIALAGVIAGLFRPDLRLLSLFLMIYVAAFLAAIFVVYFNCPHSYGSYLSSILRYMQLPVRLLHMTGLILLALTTVYWARTFVTRLPGRLATAALLGLVCLAGAYQVQQARAAFGTINDPAIEPAMKAFVERVPPDVERILALAGTRGIARPRVAMAYVYWEFLPFLIAQHASFPESRAQLPQDGTFGRMFIESLRFDDAQALIPAGSSHPRGAAEFANFDVIWSLQDIGAVSKVLAELVDDPDCAAHPSRYFVIARGDGAPGFDCVERSLVTR